LSRNVAAEKDQKGHSAEEQRFAHSACLTLRIVLMLPLRVPHLVTSEIENLLSKGWEIMNHKRRFSLGA
jgi:hypothetical protein